MSSIHFSNFRPNDDTTYFIYIGELKNYGLNLFLKETLTQRYRKKIDFLAIVPDVFEQYNYENLIVINPLIESYASKYGTKIHCRVSATEFVSAVSDNPEIRALIQTLLTRQPEIFIYMYESLPEMTLDTIAGVTLLGPDKHVARKCNNKSFQMTALQNIVPLVDFRLCSGFDDLMETTKGLWKEWTDGIFVTKEYSAAGINSVVAFSADDLREKFGGSDDPYIISRFMPHAHDPTVLAAVAAEDEVYIAGIADQRIEDGNRFTGSTFPTLLPRDVVHELDTYTRRVGTWLAQQGYRGIFGCDYIVMETNEIRFLEINARKQGTTLEFCCTLEQVLPPGTPSLPELEHDAVILGNFPETARELGHQNKGLHWGTFNYKIHETVKTNGFIPQMIGEREAFRKVAAGNLQKDYLILEHAGSDFVIAQGSFLARIVALGQDHDSVARCIEQGRKTIELTFSKSIKATQPGG